MSFVHDPRHLDKEMDEAAEAAAQVTGIEKNPLLLILYRMSHQDKQLEMIRIQMDSMGMKLYDHIAKSEEVKEHDARTAPDHYHVIDGLFDLFAFGAVVIELHANRVHLNADHFRCC